METSLRNAKTFPSNTTCQLALFSLLQETVIATQQLQCACHPLANFSKSDRMKTHVFPWQVD
jgi:hypothetical protein